MKPSTYKAGCQCLDCKRDRVVQESEGLTWFTLTWKEGAGIHRSSIGFWHSDESFRVSGVIPHSQKLLVCDENVLALRALADKIEAQIMERTP